MKAFLDNYVAPAYAKLLARPIFYPINKAVYHLGLRGMGMQNCTPSTSGEPYFIRRTLPDLLKTTPPVLFDVGANVGNYVQMLHRQFPDSIIHAFEPHPKNFEQLSARTGSYAQCHNCGLGASTGEIVLYDRADQDGSTHASMHEKIITNNLQQKTISHTVSVKTLDQIVEDCGIEHIDLLKIDTEGHEFAVLKGAEKTLKSHRISAIQFEFGTTHCFSRNFIYDFKEILPDHELFRLMPKHLLKLDLPTLETEIFGYQNIVALPRKGSC